MHLSGETLLYSATDLSNFLACGHLSLLDRFDARGELTRPHFDDPGLEVLRELGHQHETEYLGRLRSGGLSVAEIPRADPDLSSHERWVAEAHATLEAMRQGADVVYQGTLFDGEWLGKPDFLRRVETASELGEWSYEVVDTKLAREAKAGAVLQITLYSAVLSEAQGQEPASMHLALGGAGRPEEIFRYADFAAYFRLIRRQFLDAMAAADGDPPVAPDPCSHCDICAWRTRCDGERRAVDHLSLVAGISSRQRKALEEERGVTTVEGLAELSLPLELDGVSEAAATRVREQARIQVEGRRDNKPRYELLTDVVQGKGLAALPPPSPGDLFFDFEGSPYYEESRLDEPGLEYLFGWVDADQKYHARWALDRDAERKAFQEFMDFVREHWKAHPDFHIYHFHSYETSAFKRLAGRYGTREEELDQLLRGGVFVDLHRVVRQGLRASVESYSIKKLEPFYGFERDVELETASRALSNLEAWLSLRKDHEGEDQELLKEVEGYNRDDCISTLRLRDWLESLREELEEVAGEEVPRPEPEDPDLSEDGEEIQAHIQELTDGLTRDVPADLEQADEEQRARWLLAQLLGWHRREEKSMWWRYFAWMELDAQELLEDGSTLGGLIYEGIREEVKRSYVHRYRFPAQDHEIKPGDRPHDPVTEKSAGKVMTVDDVGRTIDLKRGMNNDAPHPEALIPLDRVPDSVLRESIQRTAAATIEHGLGDAHPYRAASDLLLRHRPRVGQDPGAALVPEGENASDGVIRLVPELDRSVLPIQGPPGAGKTYTGARMILTLLQEGNRVGVTATSHKVIGNLLDEICTAASENGVAIAGIQKAKEDQRSDSDEIEAVNDNQTVRHALTTGEVRLAAGTAWLWSRPEMEGSVDYLFIDEAGQFSLANALAAAPAARSLVLLGDPRQLQQPTRGVHPPGADLSVLEHLLDGEPTVPPDRGIFLPETWRLHPDVSGFTSEVFYRGRLGSRPELTAQTLSGGGPLEGAGLRFVAVRHEGNQSESPEEAAAVAELVRGLVNAGPEWTHGDGTTRTLKLDNILVVAPYNAQVTRLREALPEGARVGTVDKFQGQEGAVVIYSMTTSSPEDAPRGMSFLYSPNRLNVATSRARCLAVLVGSPELFRPECRSPRQMRLANAFCRFREMAGG